MRMRWTIVTMTMALLLSAAPAGADAPEIADPAGDANGIPVPTDTRPANNGGADLLSVDLSTTWRKVGDDRYEATGVQIRYRTLEPVASIGTSSAFRLVAEIAGCESTIEGFVEGGLSGLVGPRSGGRWVQFGDCPDLPDDNPTGFGTAVDHPGWTSKAEGHELVVTIPFETLTEAQAAYLAPGRTFEAPSALTSVAANVSAPPTGASTRPLNWDVTDPGSDFVIGSDVPSD